VIKYYTTRICIETEKNNIRTSPTMGLQELDHLRMLNKTIYSSRKTYYKLKHTTTNEQLLHNHPSDGDTQSKRAPKNKPCRQHQNHENVVPWTPAHRPSGRPQQTI
jgi:hypothetical protein